MASVMRFDQWEDSNGVPVASAANGVGKILQVVHGIKTDIFSASIASGATEALPGLSATITPSSVNSKILVLYDISGTTSDNSGFTIILQRNSTAISVGDADGTRTRVTSGGPVRPTGAALNNASAQVLDSPATTSAVTYDFLIHMPHASTLTVVVNRSQDATDVARVPLSASRITLMEVAG